MVVLVHVLGSRAYEHEHEHVHVHDYEHDGIEMPDRLANFPPNVPWSHVVLAILLVVAVIVGYIVSAALRQKRLRQAGHVPQLQRMIHSSSGLLGVLRPVLVSLALILLLIAWWRPQYAGKARMVTDRGIDLVIVLDYSKSMYARDIPLSRIQRAKQELSRLLDKLHGTRVGLVLFAGSVKEMPVTTDYGAIKLFWGDMTPNDMPVGGTAIGLALTSGVRLLKRVRGKGKPRDQVILLITDGEDHQSEPIKAAQMAKKLGIRIYTLGIGSPIGELIPEILEDGKQAGYVKFDGKFVTTKLDPKSLVKIARITSGKYIHATPARFGVDRFLKEIDKLQKSETKKRIRRDYRDSYELLLLAAVLLLLLEATLGSRRWSLRGKPATPTVARNGGPKKARPKASPGVGPPRAKGSA